MRIHQLFLSAKRKKQSLFIPYITCGDPDLQTTSDMVQHLFELGADIIELGVPFNNPLADGVVNQRSAERALKNNITLQDCAELVKKLRRNDCTQPIILFGYYNPIFKFGLHHFAKLCAECGIDSVLVVDLPLEELREFAAILKQYDVGFISLITPLSTLERIKQHIALGPEFLYYVARTGVTGVGLKLSSSLEAELQNIRNHTSFPIAVGFGISTPEHVHNVKKMADGVIVGSTLVKQLEEPDPDQAKQALFNTAKALIIANGEKP